MSPFSAFAIDAGEAYAQAFSKAQASLASMNPTDQSNRKVCTWLSTTSGASGYAYGAVTTKSATCPNSGISDQIVTFTLQAILFSGQCASRSPLTSTFAPKSGSISCSTGCEQAWFANADGTSSGQYIGTTCNTTDFPKKCGSGYYWNSVLSVCEPTKEQCPTGQTVNSLGKCAQEPCPDGMSLQQDGTCKAKENECPAGQVKSPDGSCIKKTDSCAAGQALGADGTCKPDKDGDGKPDDEDSDDDGEDDKKSFSGGDSCGSPPSCSGDPIMCGQARIQWRIDCNTRRSVNIAGGACGAPPVCTGEKCDAMEYSQLLMQWRTACAVEKLKNGSTGGGQQGDANGNGVADVLEGTGSVSDPGNGDADVAGAKRFGIGVSTDLIDKENLFGGGACPQPPTFKLMGQTISGSDFPYFCQAAAILRALILLWGAYMSLRILMGWGF
ncbi:virulence factor TspB C-terminal domain-related protein [Xanthomonas translucens]|uniref:virulence factor TspB C-terminal domain-related protein n=1 Tax=Xanthomonas campestris pv. translucens TaxID=343 RepID=UPI001F61EAFF|nr:virulence factor TspB C-terminal domain-related protein [Xanthomonas translucens]UNU12606.1 hypothetical protein KBV71_07880 [Xanthomonas translucens pv. translucens]